MSNVRRLAARAAKVRSQTQSDAESEIWIAVAEARAVADLLMMAEDVTALDRRTVQDAASAIRSRVIEVEREFALYLDVTHKRGPAPDETEPEHAQ